jgi:GNAT superfamily N-acetyltransferase
MRPRASPCDDGRVETLTSLIREATAIDAEAISRVRVRSWQAAYRGIIDDAYLDAMSIEAGRDRYLRTFDPDPAASFARVCADDDGRVTGFAMAGATRSRVAAPRSAEVYLIYLLPAVQRQGLGTRLMRSMARGLERRGMGSLVVWALVRNEPACRFYERLGGRRTVERETPVGAQRLVEVAYRWDVLDPLLGD